MVICYVSPAGNGCWQSLFGPLARSGARVMGNTPHLHFFPSARSTCLPHRHLKLRCHLPPASASPPTCPSTGDLYLWWWPHYLPNYPGLNNLSSLKRSSSSCFSSNRVVKLYQVSLCPTSQVQPFPFLLLGSQETSSWLLPAGVVMVSCFVLKRLILEL